MTEKLQGVTTEPGWSPLQGSYEEAVLSWYEQVDMSFRRHALDQRRAAQESRVRQGQATPLPPAGD
jgi:hypothetical protein